MSPPSLPIQKCPRCGLRLYTKKFTAKRAIAAVPPERWREVTYNCYFLVPKKDGTLRPILDLHPLNTYLKKIPFKMLTVQQIIQCGDWMATIDLRTVRSATRTSMSQCIQNTGNFYSVC